MSSTTTYDHSGLTSKRPHIILFNPDQWRGDVTGYTGNRAAVTPTLDELVQTDGVAFEQAFCQNPVCTPSRCSFMTGWYPHVRGHRTMFSMLQPDEPMLLKRLKDEGYFVWWGGKNDVVPAQNGFSAYCDVKYQPVHAPKGYPPEEQWRGLPGNDTYYSFYIGRLEKDADAPYYYDHDWAMIEGAIDQIKNAPPDQPLCLYLPLLFPHPPYGVEDPWYSQIDRAHLPTRIPAPTDWQGRPAILKGIAERQGLQNWSEERWTELRVTYYAMCARVDYQVKLVIEALREKGMYDDSAIFIFSDHGDFTGDYGLVEKTQNTFQDCLTRVPLIVKPPRGVHYQAGVRKALVELIDIPATIEELAHLPATHTHSGRSLLPLLADDKAPGRDAVFCEGGRLQGERQAMELESQDNQVPTGLYWPRLSLQRLEGPYHSKATMCRTHEYKYVRRLYESDELYDLRTDPQEQHNRINDPALAPILLQLKDRLLTFYQETCDVVPYQIDRRS